jgi:hypothetical protein
MSIIDRSIGPRFLEGPVYSIKAKQEDREVIARRIEAFIAAGGVVQQIEPGVMTATEHGVFMSSLSGSSDGSGKVGKETNETRIARENYNYSLRRGLLSYVGVVCKVCKTQDRWTKSKKCKVCCPVEVEKPDYDAIRKAAKKAGNKHFEGKPCPKDLTNIRDIKSGKCVCCMKENNRRKTLKVAEKREKERG